VGLLSCPSCGSLLPEARRRQRATGREVRRGARRGRSEEAGSGRRGRIHRNRARHPRGHGNRGRPEPPGTEESRISRLLPPACVRREPARQFSAQFAGAGVSGACRPREARLWQGTAILGGRGTQLGRRRRSRPEVSGHSLADSGLTSKSEAAGSTTWLQRSPAISPSSQSLARGGRSWTDCNLVDTSRQHAPLTRFASSPEDRTHRFRCSGRCHARLASFRPKLQVNRAVPLDPCLSVQVELAQLSLDSQSQ